MYLKKCYTAERLAFFLPQFERGNEMSPLKEKAIAEINALNDDQLSAVLRTISELKETKNQAAERERIRLEAKKAFDEIRAESQKYPKLTLDEINEEIRLAREERKKRMQTCS
ncbi:MAG: hypothetical protein J6A01_04875 [Proteobacteria bacterium]|nr:hypothetical protein [Pseudomonadota bacterium]